MIIRTRLLFSLLLSAFSVVAEITHEGGSCGRDGVPFRVVVDRNGRPEIFCSSPSCSELGAGRPNARCTSKYLETVCLAEDEWTGGLIEINNGTHRTLKTQCCQFAGLDKAAQLKSIMLEGGDSFTGGISKDSPTPSYDIVKEIRKTISSENQVQYIISIYRLPCTETEAKDNFYMRSRIRRKLNQAATFDYDEMGRDRYVPRRRYNSRRRHPGRRGGYYRNYEYDDMYDYDYAMPRRYRGYRTRERLWPVAYPSRRAYGENIYDTEEPVPYQSNVGDLLLLNPSASTASLESSTGRSYTRALAAKLAREAYQGGMMPAAPSASAYVPSMPLDSTNIAPAQLIPPTGSSYPSFGAAVPAPAPLPPPPTPLLSAGPVGPPVYATSYSQGAGLQTAMSQYAQAPSYSTSYVQPPASPACGAPIGCSPSAQAAQPSPSYQSSYPSSYPSSYGYPSYSGANLNSLFGKLQCFSGAMEVETPSGKKTLSELQVGDLVLSIDENMIQFSPILMFLHKLDEEEAEFNQFTLESGEVIELTDDHLIYINDCGEEDLRLVHAKDVAHHHCLHATLNSVAALGAKRISKITKVNRRGIYAPLTSSGDLFVNSVLASCHSNVALKALQQTFFTLHRKVSNFFFPQSTSQSELPTGVAYLTTVMDLFLPKQFF